MQQMSLSALRVKKDYYTTKQISEIYHVSQATVCNWCRAGILQAHKQGEGKSKWLVHPQAIEDIETKQEQLIEASRRYWVRLAVKLRR